MDFDFPSGVCAGVGPGGLGLWARLTPLSKAANVAKI